MEVDNEGQLNFYARVKQAQNQRRMNADYAIVDRKQENTLLLREVDDMNEEDILKLFGPNLKDEIVSIRLFPPIPGTRGFAFIEFSDAITAIRAFTVKHRSTWMYKGHPKKINLSRPTKGKSEEEWKWDKVQAERQGRPEALNTPRRTVLTNNGPLQVDPEKSVVIPEVPTVPLTELMKAASEREGDGESSAQQRDSSTSDQPPLKKKAVEGSGDRPEARGADLAITDKVRGSRSRSPRRPYGSGRASSGQQHSPSRSDNFSFSRRDRPDRSHYDNPFRPADSRASSSSRNEDRYGGRDRDDRRNPFSDRRERYDERRDRYDDRNDERRGRYERRSESRRDDDDDRRRR